jgi:20S proteasome subunit beta 5
MDGFGNDLDFLDDPNFGDPDFFTKAPISAMGPTLGFSMNMNEADFNNEFDVNEDLGEIKSDGFCFRLAPDENPSEFARSLKHLAPKIADFKHGTTTLAFEFKEGVIVAVDARATQGAFIASNKVRKVIEINEYLLGTMAGGAADCQYWERYLAMQCRIYELRNSEKISIAAASKILADICHSYRGYGLSMGTMVTGSDLKKGAQLFYVDNDATRVRGQMFSVGSGSPFAYGVLDNNYKWDLTLDEGIALGIRAIASATHKDSASGGVVRVYHVNNHGSWTKIHDALDVDELHWEFEQSKGLRGDGKEGFAPFKL